MDINAIEVIMVVRTTQTVPRTRTVTRYEVDIERMGITLSDTDFEILRLCSENRETPVNIAAHLDIEPNYASTELTKLRRHNYIEKPGPADNSGMNETTEIGGFALSKQAKYTHEHAELFTILIKRTFKYTDEFGIEPEDILCYSNKTVRIIQEVRPLTVQTAANAIDDDLNRMQNAITYLYDAWFYDLLETEPWDGEVDLTERGHTVAAAAAHTARELHEEIYG